MSEIERMYLNKEILIGGNESENLDLLWPTRQLSSSLLNITDSILSGQGEGWMGSVSIAVLGATMIMALNWRFENYYYAIIDVVLPGLLLLLLRPNALGDGRAVLGCVCGVVYERRRIAAATG